MNFEETLAKRSAEAERILSAYLPKEAGYAATVLEAMRYSAMSGGKRLRPVLMYESFLLFGGKGALVEPFMAALEMIHNYSLVHDDLPAMDNDEYRRGRKTTWRVYGDGMAVLAGDGLLNCAFETAAAAFDMVMTGEGGETLSAGECAGRFRAAARAMQVLAKKAGIFGMIGGQCADVEAETLPPGAVTEERLLYIHENKTAALIEAAMMIGAILAGADEEAVARMERAARNVGVAFQIQDDILDVVSTTEALGKPVGSDEKNNKVTYVRLNGLEKSRADVDRLSREALDILRSFEVRSPFLEQLVESLITREK